MDVRSRRVSSTHAWRGRRSRRSEISSSGALCGDHQVGGCWLSGSDFYTRGCFLFRLPSSRFSCCCGFRLRLLRPGRLPGGGHIRLPGHRRDRLRSWFYGNGCRFSDLLLLWALLVFLFCHWLFLFSGLVGLASRKITRAWCTVMESGAWFRSAEQRLELERGRKREWKLNYGGWATVFCVDARCSVQTEEGDV